MFITFKKVGDKNTGEMEDVMGYNNRMDDTPWHITYLKKETENSLCE